jgi:hypothetical protein
MVTTDAIKQNCLHNSSRSACVVEIYIYNSLVYFVVHSDATVPAAKVLGRMTALLTMSKWEYVKGSGTTRGFPYSICEKNANMDN